MHMEVEFEAKFYPVNKVETRNKLSEIGATCTHPERLMRRTMATKDKYPQLPCDYIRVRDEGDVIRMSAKVHASSDGNLSDQKELDFLVSNFEKAVEMITIMGYKPEMYQETFRETWQIDDAEIVIDTWPGLKPYIEIESTSEARVRSVAESLGLSWNARRITSVIEIYAEIYHLTNKTVKELISHLTFDKNPFEENMQNSL